VAPPSWLAAALAAILLVIAGYCATRLATAHRLRRSTDHGADVMHVVMGVAMAGMLVPRLSPLQARPWAVLFAAGAAWFAGHAVRARWRTRATAAPHAAGPRAAGRPVPGGQHGAHVLSCSVMVYMLLAGPDAGARMGAGPGAGLLPVAALFLAVAVAVSVVVSIDRLPALRPALVPVITARPPLVEAGPTSAQAGPAPGTAGQAAGAGAAPAPAGQRPVLCPRLAACCQIMMGVATAYMLILML
jgi:hypothetical protein